MPRAHLVLLLLALGALPAPARAQHGELQLGLAVSHGSAAAFGTGVGPVAGVALGRLAYVGVRWLHLRGSTTGVESGDAHAEVRTRAQLFTVDLGVVIPMRGVELVPGVSVGVARFRQRGGDWTRAKELVVAPGMAVHVYLAGLVLIPELQYSLTGRPDDAMAFENRGRLASFRIAIPIELGRIRQ